MANAKKPWADIMDEHDADQEEEAADNEVPKLATVSEKTAATLKNTQRG